MQLDELSVAKFSERVNFIILSLSQSVYMNSMFIYILFHLGKKHQYNLQRRAAEQAREGPSTLQPEKAKVEPKKFIKIGRPGYKVIFHWLFIVQSQNLHLCSVDWDLYYELFFRIQCVSMN